ncbi:MAG: histidine decarboxylase, pyruvoyl type [Candidatus Nealsonbacteria bacterium]
MRAIFSKKKILKSAISPFDQYCTGYPGQGTHITALVMEIGSFKESFSHLGSKKLDSIVAYDKAEVGSAYIGQINMSVVSSFCGPQGLIWGYDIAKKEGTGLPSFLSKNGLKKFRGIKIKNGKNLREATEALFGTNNERHFPFLPGTHVPCAVKLYYKSGPAYLYGTAAIGIPEDRNNAACLFMEDVGEIITEQQNIDDIKEKVYVNTIQSIIEIGKNQGVKYSEIFVDFISKKIKSGERGCVLVAIPYFQLAQKAFNRKLAEQNILEWVDKSKKYFLHN